MSPGSPYRDQVAATLSMGKGCRNGCHSLSLNLIARTSLVILLPSVAFGFGVTGGRPIRSIMSLDRLAVSAGVSLANGPGGFRLPLGESMVMVG